MEKGILKEKEIRSDGLSIRYNTCQYRKMMLTPNMDVSPICKVCSKSYQEGYIKGYKASTRSKK